LFIIGVLLASIWLEAYLRRRRNGQADGDWTFLQNRRALAAGGVAAGLVIAPNLGSPGNLGFAVPTSIVLGGLVAMTLNRYGPFAGKQPSATDES
jgi:hypothetical protein